MVVDAASLLIEVYALPVGFVSQHECTGNVRVRFGLKPFAEVLFFEPDCISLATQSATVAWDLLTYGLLLQNPISRCAPLRDSATDDWNSLSLRGG